MKPLSPTEVHKIKIEHQKYLASEETLHNQDLHKRILQTWQQASPKMHLRLQAQGALEAMAYVCQQRMWAQRNQLLKSGMPLTDAREQAEREQLMLEPEAQPA